MTADERWMRRAIELARAGRGAVEPNPLVGAVVVRDDQVVGEGWHKKYGGPHAEVFALDAAGEAARGATLYVTLEPCCHHGKTPPCTDAIIKSGIAKIVAAMADPFPAVAGEGLRTLRAAGVTVEVGVCESEARRLNAPYLKLLTTGHPWIHAKWAMTLDGKIASRSGDSRWISNEASRRRVHELRGRVDGIVVGINTVLADNPELTARPPGSRIPVRIVLDSSGQLPADSILARTARSTPTLLATTSAIEGAHRRELESLGVEVLVLPTEGAGRPSLSALLSELGRRRMTNLLVEGGGELLGSFRDALAIDEVHVFIAPRLIGGSGATVPVGGKGVERIHEALALVEPTVEVIDGDIHVHGLIARPGPV
jgi:diaminohydroxyphosphoribosylaminopyrimidine deaminase / 5-amino-6-(5-phosphoribosylamino)uracil reductase